MHEELAKKMNQMMSLLNEKQLRKYLGSEAEALGFGGIAIVSKISGKSRNTIVAGMKENRMPEENPGRLRKSGGGRKSVRNKYPEIAAEIKRIVSNSPFGNPENPLAHTTKSTRKIKRALNEKGCEIGRNAVAGILDELGYRLQLNQKMFQAGRNARTGTPNLNTLTANRSSFCSPATR